MDEPRIIIPKSARENDEDRVREAAERYGEGSYRHRMAVEIRNSNINFRNWVDGKEAK